MREKDFYIALTSARFMGVYRCLPPLSMVE